jgi:hypothetical protein
VALTVLAALMAIGSIGPWASVGLFSVSGTEGDGAVTLVGAILVLLLAALSIAQPRNWKFVVAGLLSLGIAIVGTVDWWDLNRLIADEEFGSLFRVEVGWGLVLMTFAGYAATGVALASIRRRPSAPATPEEIEIPVVVEPYTPVVPPPGYRGPREDN